MTTTPSARDQCAIFLPVIEHFVSGETSAIEFEAHYLDLVKRTPGVLHPDVSATVNRLFSDVDSFVAEERLRRAGDLDEHQLLMSAREAAIALKRLQSTP